VRIKAQFGPFILRKKAHYELKRIKRKRKVINKGVRTLITKKGSLHLPTPKNSQKIPSDRENCEESRSGSSF
jgi:hypothetical protein